MISITCTQCQTVLEIDDAFAGGVCRCQHCGTIQTVPSRLKPTATPQPNVHSSSMQSKALYHNDAAGRGPAINSTGASASPSGLDDLANAVATSSGLSGSGLRGGNLKAAPPASKTKPAAKARPAAVRTPPPVDYSSPETEEDSNRKKSPVMIFVVIGVLLLLIVGGGLLFMLGRASSTASSTGGTGSGTGASTGTGANFCGEPIAGNNVIYLLDDANSISNDFDPLRAATYTSIATLGADHQFAVLLWNNGGEEFAFPHDGYVSANSQQVSFLRSKFEDVQATGESHIRSALTSAMARTPSAIIIVTGKTRLDDEDEAALGAAKDAAAGKTKFYTFTVNAPGDNQFLKMTAEGTGGKYRQLSSQDLRAATP